MEASTTELVNTETATVQHTVGESYYHDLPAVMGADIRLAESLLQLQPGYVPMQPNGDAVFRGSQFTSRMNGGQTLGRRTGLTARRLATPRVINRRRRARFPIRPCKK